MSSLPTPTPNSAAAAAYGGPSGGGASTSPGFFRSLGDLGLGYTIAIALGLLILLSTILLASYICCRARARARSASAAAASGPNASGPDGIVLPRIIFVAEDDEEGMRGDGDDDAGRVAGLDQTVINSYPKFVFARSRDLGGGDAMCSICLCDYKEGEMMRMMPDCRHFFHLSCVDAWLRIHASCPVCRNSPLPTPLSTPLSELVPLSQYGDNRRR
ncbi:hypothetical protein Syun_013285 [Stephania yunnanensis]|uniref:RING-type domain-containing protein n=1 Tax=Stephania yunnanensis TaxID=152371 RepID=A0AAP0K210_9MAGN